MRFDVTGPFDLGRHGKKSLITKQSQVDLKHQLKNLNAGLDDSCGCYVFALKAGRGYTPYYVGQACRRGIIDEALNSGNREKYNKVCSESKGTPVIFLIPMLTPTGRYRKKRTNGNLGAIDFLERWLIATAIRKNPDLINNKEPRFLRNIHVAGIFNPTKGEATKASSLLGRTLW